MSSLRKELEATKEEANTKSQVNSEELLQRLESEKANIHTEYEQERIAYQKLLKAYNRLEVQVLLLHKNYIFTYLSNAIILFVKNSFCLFLKMHFNFFFSTRIFRTNCVTLVARNWCRTCLSVLRCFQSTSTTKNRPMVRIQVLY